MVNFADNIISPNNEVYNVCHNIILKRKSLVPQAILPFFAWTWIPFVLSWLNECPTWDLPLVTNYADVSQLRET